MKCSNHPTVEATVTCDRCGRALCDECRVEINGRFWCSECLAAAVDRAFDRRRRWRSSKLAAALLSIFPGAGHMYLGLIGKGFALMGFLFSAIFLVILYSASTGMYWITAYLIPTLAVLFLSYAVFDSIAVAEAIRSGEAADSVEDPIMERIWAHILLNPRTAGYVILVAGIIGLIDLFSRPLDRLLRQSLSVNFSITALIIPVVLVVIGGVLLRRSRRVP